MIDVNFLISYAERLKNAIESINYKQVIVDRDQLVKFLEERTKEDKHMLFMLIPSYGTEGKNDDDMLKRADTVIFVLQKTDYSSLKHDEFLQIIQETLMTAKAIEDKMKADKNDFSEEGCMYMKQLNVASINIDPVWGLAECNGWTIEFNFKND